MSNRNLPVLVAGGMQQASVENGVTTMADIKSQLSLNPQMKPSSNGIILQDNDVVDASMTRVTFAAGSKNNS